MRVIQFIIDDEPGVDRDGDAVIIDDNRVGMASCTRLLLKQCNAMRRPVCQRVSSAIAGYACANDGNRERMRSEY